MDDFYKLHAEMCKTIANPVRLQIIHTIRDQELSAAEILKQIPISKANLSQHINILTQKGVVISRKESVHVYYKLGDKRIIQACDLIKEVLKSWIDRNNMILKSQ